MSYLSQDLRYGFRVMRKSPGFVIIAVLALALGTGTNTAIFSLVNALLLRPINYENPDRLAMVWEKSVKRGFGQVPTSLLNFADLRTGNQTFEDLGAFTDSSFNLTGAAEPEKVMGVSVTATLLSLLGRQPLKGRLFLAGEDQPQASHVLILSHHLWQRSFGSNPNLVGPDGGTQRRKLHGGRNHAARLQVSAHVFRHRGLVAIYDAGRGSMGAANT